jgi:lipoteichoic acid synthase
MPTLRRLRREGLWFSQILDQSGDGRTSDAEFMLATSLLPMDQGAAAFVFPHHHYTSLPRVLRDAGYHTMLAIPFQPDFWNREVTHRAYGFERALFDRDFAPGPAEGWGLNDGDFLSQLAERIAAAPHPLYATAITLSLHHPYDTFPGEMKIGDMGRLEGTRLGNYLHAMRFVDAALARFIERLQQTGALDRTTLVVLGDHDAGLSWSGGLAGLLNAQDPVTRLLHDRVPLLIWATGGWLRAREITTVGGQTDVPTTIAALLGVNPDGLPFIGRNLLGAPGTAPVPLSHGQWASDRHAWIEAGRATGCYDIAARARVAEVVCAPEAALVSQTRAASQAILVHDLQAKLAGGSLLHGSIRQAPNSNPARGCC